MVKRKYKRGRSGVAGFSMTSWFIFALVFLWWQGALFGGPPSSTYGEDLAAMAEYEEDQIERKSVIEVNENTTEEDVFDTQNLSIDENLGVYDLGDLLD